MATYDSTRYQLVVYVTNAQGGSGLETTVLLYLVGEEGKLDEVIFDNRYDRPSIPEEPETPKPPMRPDDTPPVDEEVEIEEPIPEDVPVPEEPVEEEEIDEPIPTDSPKSPPTDKPDVPKTGDDTVVWPYIGLFISGAAMLILLGFTIKKNQINE